MGISVIRPLFWPPIPPLRGLARGHAQAEATYLALLADGARPQEARSVLPTPQDRIVMTANLRSVGTSSPALRSAPIPRCASSCCQLWRTWRPLPVVLRLAKASRPIRRLPEQPAALEA